MPLPGTTRPRYLWNMGLRSAGKIDTRKALWKLGCKKAEGTVAILHGDPLILHASLILVDPPYRCYNTIIEREVPSLGIRTNCPRQDPTSFFLRPPD